MVSMWKTNLSAFCCVWQRWTSNFVLGLGLWSRLNYSTATWQISKTNLTPCKCRYTRHYLCHYGSPKNASHWCHKHIVQLTNLASAEDVCVWFCWSHDKGCEKFLSSVVMCVYFKLPLLPNAFQIVSQAAMHHFTSNFQSNWSKNIWKWMFQTVFVHLFTFNTYCHWIQRQQYSLSFFG